VAPRRFSRYTFATALRDADGDLVLYGDEPYRFRNFEDNREHVVREGDTLFSLAAQYFLGVPRPDGLFWVIMDFQPEPIHDPTIELAVGRVLIIPSLRTLQEEIFSARRRQNVAG
jgi:hypothetical protein